MSFIPTNSLGTVMLKFSSLGKPVERRFHLSRDNRLVQWSSFSFNFWKNRSSEWMY